MNINWYPGHMKKTKDLLLENLKLVDIVIELLDSRIPKSSKNPNLENIINNKPKIIIMNKSDLSSLEYNNIWKKELDKESIKTLFINSLNKKDVDRVTSEIQKILEQKIEEKKKKGMNNTVIRAMIVGIPNVGKSTLINSLSGRKGAKTGNRPGVTKGKQWIKIKNNIELLDTPGILWPKIEDKEVGLNLAFTGAIKDEILDIETLALNFIERLIKIDIAILEKRYELSLSGLTALEVMDAVGRKRGTILKKSEVDYTRVSNLILDEFRKGKLGRLTIEFPKKEDKNE